MSYGPSTYPIPLPPVVADHTGDCNCPECLAVRRAIRTAPLPAPDSARRKVIGRGLTFAPKSETEDWKADARCRPLDPDTFFPPRGDVRQIRAAKRVCIGCPVRRECLIHALTEPRERDGIWGGLSGHERRKLTAADVATGPLPPVMLNGQPMEAAS